MKDINNQIEPNVVGPITSREGEKGIDLNDYKHWETNFWNITIYPLIPPEDQD